MDISSFARRTAPLAAVLAFSATQAAAQRVDDRFPFLQPLAAAPAPSPDYVRVGGTGSRTTRPARLVHRVAQVPFPRPVPLRQDTATSSDTSTVQTDTPEATPARTRLAYAAQPADDDLAIWAMIPIQPAARRPQSLPTLAVLPETAALPHLEHKILRGRDRQVFSPELLIMIENKAIAHGVPLDLAHAVITVESNYDPRLTGGAGALGLMQIKHSTARGMGFSGSARDLYNPETNLEWGMRYLAKARKLAKGDLCGTVLRYQAGHGTARMTRAAAVYCAKVRALIAASDTPSRIAQARATQ